MKMRLSYIDWPIGKFLVWSSTQKLLISIEWPKNDTETVGSNERNSLDDIVQVLDTEIKVLKEKNSVTDKRAHVSL